MFILIQLLTTEGTEVHRGIASQLPLAKRRIALTYAATPLTANVRRDGGRRAQETAVIAIMQTK